MRLAVVIILAISWPAIAAPFDPWAVATKRAGVEETAVPCEVQANRKASPCSKCADKAGGCDCVGGCGCEAKAARAVESVAARSARVMAARLTIPVTAGPGGPLLYYRDISVADYVAEGGSLDAIRQMPEADRAALRGTGPAAPPVILPTAAPAYPVAPVADPGPVRVMPARMAPGPLLDFGMQFRGPFGGGFGAGACVGGT